MGLEAGNYYVVPSLSLYYNYWAFLLNLYGEMLGPLIHVYGN